MESATGVEDVRLIHGDCLEVLPTLAAGSVDAIVTDPPYGIDYQSARRTDRSAWLPKIANDKEPFTAWLPEAFRVTKEGSALACFCAWQTQEAFCPHGGLVLEPFAGSAATAVACMKTGRRCLAIELDERYIEPARRRLKANETPPFAMP